MGSREHIIDDFSIGVRVMPLDGEEMVLVVLNIDKERNVVICQVPGERSVRAYLPHELKIEAVRHSE